MIDRNGARNARWLLLLSAATVWPAHAQVTPAPTEQEVAGEGDARGVGMAGDGSAEALSENAPDDIVITGQAERGAVIGDVPPEQQLSPADIQAYGVNSIAELLTELSPQLASGRGRGGEGPVVLLEGRRIGSFREIAEIPTEAILRVDILPEEVALKYGYSANQRVVNFVLRPRFRAITAETEIGGPTEGGSTNGEVELSYLRISPAGRLNVGLEVEARSMLLESERDLLSNPAGLPFDLIGNVVARVTEDENVVPPATGTEIDPALSAAAGRRVTVAAVPGSAATGSPLLADFVGGANVPNVTDLGPFRSLQGATEAVRGNAVLARTLFGNVAATATIGFDFNDNRSLLGLPSVDLTLPADNPFSPFAGDVRVLRYSDALGPLMREARTRNVEAAFSMNGNVSSWRWTLTGNYNRQQTDTDTDRKVDSSRLQAAVVAGASPFGPIAASQLSLIAPDTARAISNVARLDGVLNGNVLALPAGDVSTTFRIGLRSQDQDARSVRSGEPQETDITRRSGNGQLNIDVPLTSRRRAVLDAIGDLSLNANVEVDHLSDFGTLTSYGYGLNWSPITQIRLIASVTNEEGAPSPQQVGNPAITTPNVRVFDFVRGETVDVTFLSGGNPLLRSDSRDVLKLGMNLRPFDETDLNIRADYTSSTIEDSIAGFPTATSEIQAAFPERFTRDPSGRLLQIDSRPVNFARNERQEFRWGFNLTLPVTGTVERQVQAARDAGQDPRAVLRQAYGRPDRPQRPAADGTATPPPAEGSAGQTAATETRPSPQGEPPRGGEGRGPGGPGGGFGGGGGRGFGGAGAGGGRIQFSAFHTYRIKETILIRQGVPELDLLNGSATGSNGGLARHQIEVRSGFTKDGLGARLNANWQSGTRVDGAVPSDTLFFGDLATVELRLFANLGQIPSIVRNNRWLRGSRVSFAVTNLFNQRLDVRNASGEVPRGYQPALLDPVGRSVRLDFRKLF
ncbi:hypothetical protein [Sphingomonas sp. 37zxx]|uniref:hypothetical protein n=1 Tax=Sphingomonas sp. 37zxx TaxID=1550073 RepID=UPI000690B500|nr:hypothetical protein [Sphingomonas sp. 37zxx]